MDADHDVIVHCEIVDKCEVQLKSPNMERLGLQWSLHYLQENLVVIDELVTDASIVIISMIGEKEW